MKKTGNEKLIEQLLADGCYYMFGNPGTVEQGFLDAMGKYPSFKYITCLQESIAVAMADGYARKTNRPAVVQLHSGVGLGNGIGMLYQAMRGHSPLIVLAGEAGIRYDAMDAQMACDLVKMAEPVTKWSGRVLHKDSLLRLLRRAVKIAMTPPMGPVFLSLPLDVLGDDNTESVYPSVRINMDNVPSCYEDIEKTANLLINAKKPLFIVGDGISFSDGQADLERLADIIGAYVWGADSSLVNFNRSSYLYQGELGHMFGFTSYEAVKDADVILIVGTYVFPEVFPMLDNPFREDAKIIHIDLDTYEIAKNHGVTIAIASNPAHTIRCIADNIIRSINEGQKYKVNIRKDEMKRKKKLSYDNYDDSDILSQFCSSLKKSLDDKFVIFDEALTASPIINHYFQMEKPGTFFQTRGGSLGVGIPGALGIKLAAPEQRIIAFTGDGGSMYTIQSLHTAARYNIGAKHIIINNGSYKLLKDNIDEYWKENNIIPHTYPDCFSLKPEIDFVKLSEAMGVKARMLSDKNDVEEAVIWLTEDDEPALLEIRV